LHWYGRRYACNENRLINYKGFGAKTQESILKNILFIRANQNFRLWAEMEQPANKLIANLLKTNSGKQFSITGPMRRQSSTIEYLDVVTDVDKDKLKAQFATTLDTAFEETEDTLIAKIRDHQNIRFYLTDAHNFYKKLFLTTGSDDFIAAFKQQYTIPDVVTAEMDIFNHNNLDYIPPAMRERANILVKAAAKKLPQLIQSTDIKGIIHSHSTWSDGADKLEQMAVEAQKKGFEYLVISDHSQSAFYANGLTPERIAQQHAEIDALNAKLAPFKIFKSIESDILNDGSLDYSNNVLGTFDLVIASVHSNLKMTQEKAMERVLTAIRNPYTTILGHPTGRLLLSREGYPLDHKAIIDECVKHNVVIEINAHPRRLDLDWEWIEYAIEAGALLSIDPDAHAAVAYHDVYYGVMTAQKGGLTKERNLSSFSLQEFEAFLAKKRVM
jgi:DNA polymerase (family 10)